MKPNAGSPPLESRRCRTELTTQPDRRRDRDAEATGRRAATRMNASRARRSLIGMTVATRSTIVPGRIGPPVNSLGGLSGSCAPNERVRPLAELRLHPRSARQTRSGVSGRSMWRTPRWDSASTTAFCTAGVEPIVADSPIPFTPSGFRCVGVSVFDDLERREVGGARHLIRREGRRHRVAALVVPHLFEQRLRDALPEPTVLLASHQHRVEDPAAVVDGDVTEQLHLPGRGVHLDDRDVRAERERRSALPEATFGPDRSPARWPPPRPSRRSDRARRATANPPSTRSTSAASTSRSAAATSRPFSTTASACS